MGKIIEEGIDQNDDVGTAFQTGKVSSNTGEYQFFAVKLGAEASKAEPLSCVETCDLENGAASHAVKEGSCLIDNVCYQKGETAELFGRSCLVCDPLQSQTEWSHGSEIGVDVCFIDNVCYDQGDAYSYRKSRSETLVSECQICEPKLDAASWSVKLGFQLVTGVDVEPPNDCIQRHWTFQTISSSVTNKHFRSANRYLQWWKCCLFLFFPLGIAQGWINFHLRHSACCDFPGHHPCDSFLCPQGHDEKIRHDERFRHDERCSE